MKKYLLLLLILPLVFSSCENSDGMSDDELIMAIINADNRIKVSENDLPKSAITSLDFNKPGDVIGSAELAPELGYEVEMKSWNFFDFELDYERDDNEYFTTNGRRLEASNNGKDWSDKKSKDGKDGKKKKGPCFKFKYPVSYTMGDGTVISGNDRKEIHGKMKEYFEKNGKTKENKPKINFPVTILSMDDNKNVIEKKIETHEAMKEVMAYCKGAKGDKGDDKKKD